MTKYEHKSVIVSIRLAKVKSAAPARKVQCLIRILTVNKRLLFFIFCLFSLVTLLTISLIRACRRGRRLVSVHVPQVAVVRKAVFETVTHKLTNLDGDWFIYFVHVVIIRLVKCARGRVSMIRNTKCLDAIHKTSDSASWVSTVHVATSNIVIVFALVHVGIIFAFVVTFLCRLPLNTRSSSAKRRSDGDGGNFFAPLELQLPALADLRVGARAAVLGGAARADVAEGGEGAAVVAGAIVADGGAAGAYAKAGIA